MFVSSSKYIKPSFWLGLASYSSEQLYNALLVEWGSPRHIRGSHLGSFNDSLFLPPNCRSLRIWFL